MLLKQINENSIQEHLQSLDFFIYKILLVNNNSFCVMKSVKSEDTSDDEQASS